VIDVTIRPEGHDTMTGDLKIAAVIPLYNGAHFVESALASVFAQTLPADEIIVVDDGSTDDGPEMVERMARQRPITLLRKVNGGQSSARNFGIARSASPLIALLDQDDIWYPDHLEHLVRPFREVHYPSLGWVYSNLDEIDRDGRMVTRSCLDVVPAVEHPKRTLVGCLRNDMFVLPSSSLMSREAFEKAGGFDERLIGYEDDDLFLRMFRQGFENIYLRRPLTQWRIYSGSTSYAPVMDRSRMIYFHKLVDTFESPPGVEPDYVRNLVAPRFFPWVIREYQRARRSKNDDRLRTAVEDIRVLLPYLAPRLRSRLRIMLPVMGSRTFTRLTNRLVGSDMRLLRPLIRFFFFNRYI
jgi:glycosyltransferase involved in cell wall biosynthesis